MVKMSWRSGEGAENKGTVGEKASKLFDLCFGCNKVKRFCYLCKRIRILTYI